MTRERRVVRVALDQHEELRIVLRARELVELAVGLVGPDLLRQRLDRARRDPAPCPPSPSGSPSPQSREPPSRLHPDISQAGALCIGREEERRWRSRSRGRGRAGTTGADPRPARAPARWRWPRRWGRFASTCSTTTGPASRSATSATSRSSRATSSTDTVTWIEVEGLGDERALRRIGEIFQIHPLALADAVNTPQRPKAESYENHDFLVCRMAQLARTRDRDRAGEPGDRPALGDHLPGGPARRLRSGPRAHPQQFADLPDGRGLPRLLAARHADRRLLPDRRVARRRARGGGGAGGGRARSSATRARST